MKSGAVYANGLGWTRNLRVQEKDTCGNSAVKRRKSSSFVLICFTPEPALAPAPTDKGGYKRGRRVPLACLNEPGPAKQ